jgi:hypothetical protein
MSDRTTRNGAAPLSLAIDAEALRPLVREIVAEVLAELHAAEAAAGGKLAYGESEAAALLSMQPHQLRDCRLRGEIGASVGPNRTVLYRKEDLAGYLAGRRWRKVDNRGD